MHQHRSTAGARAIKLSLSAALLCLASLASAQQNAPQPPPAATTVALPLAYPTEFNGDLRTLPQTYTPPEYYLLLNEYEDPPNQKPPPGPEASSPQPNIEMLGPMPTSTNFAGLGFTTAVNGGQAGGGWPPDTNGDVGPTYYIQSVNTAFGIFNKSTGALVTSFTINQLWASSGTSTICLNQNRGDPVVMHDARNDRWLIIDFAFGTSAGKPAAPFYQCIAVSQSNDPVGGGWRFYAVQVDTGASGGPPAGTLNDYLKFGLWNDGCLYMGANGFTEPAGTYAGSIVASFSTTDMYAGNPLTSSIGFLSYGSANEFSLFPADLLGSSAGSLPPAGTPEYFVAESQSIYGLNVRKFTPGTNCGGGGIVSAATSVPHASYTYNGGHFIPQQGSATLLDSLEDRVMQRVQYRKIGSAESLWVVHTTGSTPAQPQWVQVNVSGGTIVTTPVQQQIYAPDTTKYRWMPALAVDQQGNMAMGYSRSSATDYPSIYYAGRLAGDPLNTLPQSEVAMVTGGGGQNNTCGGAACYRWGDYSSMTIDPSDDCTFWYTTEYYDTQTNGNSGNWQTRIGSFKYPGCVTIGPATKLVFGQQPTNTAAGASITPAVTVQVQDANGNVVTGSTASITVAIGTNPGSSTLGGTATANAVNGVATFSNLSLNKTGTGYTLAAASTGLTGATSSTFNITAGTASKLVFGQQPTNTAAGASITPAVTVQVQDANGNVVTGSTASITLAIGTNPGSSTLSGSATVNAVNGVATFSNLSLNKTGTGYTLTAASTGLTGATSSTFNITAGTASKLVFGQQPTNTAAGASITPAVTVQVQDANGNVVTGSTASITLAIGTNPGSSTLSGSATVNAVNGVAAFGNLSLNKPGTGYTLTAASTGLTGATSNAFNIAVGPAANIAFTQQPSDALAGMANNPAIVATVTDIAGNPVAGESVSLTVASGPAAAFTAITNPQTTDASGKATFADAVLTVAGTYTLGAADGALNATSNSFKVLAASPDHLAFTPVPGDIVQGQSLGTVTVTEYDAFNNQVVADNTTLVSLTAGSCGGTVLGGSQALNGGAVSFVTTQLFMTVASGVSLSATPGASPPTAASSTFNVASNTDFVFSDGFDGCRP